MAELEPHIAALFQPDEEPPVDYGDCATCPIVCNAHDIIQMHRDKTASLTEDIASGKLEMAAMQAEQSSIDKNGEAMTFEEALSIRLQNYSRILDQSEKSIEVQTTEIEKVRRLCRGVLPAIARQIQHDGRLVELELIACGSPTITPHDLTTGQAERVATVRRVLLAPDLGSDQSAGHSND